MLPRKSNLIVPVRDRRQHRRILTIKNFRNAGILALLLFAVITIRSEMRGSREGEYGRLVSRELPADVARAPKPVEVVTASSINDETSADPMLVAPASREQLLLAGTNVPAPPLPANAAQTLTSTVDQPPPARLAQHGRHVAIVGGTEGVTAVESSADHEPLLKGGFGRQ